MINISFCIIERGIKIVLVGSMLARKEKLPRAEGVTSPSRDGSRKQSGHPVHRIMGRPVKKDSAPRPAVSIVNLPRYQVHWQDQDLPKTRA